MPTPGPLDAHDHTRERHLTRRGVLWVGLRCDVRCTFCYDEHLPTRDKVWVPFEDAARSLEKFRGFYGNTAVDFMGGEPTLHPRMVDIVQHAAGIGLRPTVITHGMHLAAPGRAKAYADSARPGAPPPAATPPPVTLAPSATPRTAAPTTVPTTSDLASRSRSP